MFRVIFHLEIEINGKTQTITNTSGKFVRSESAEEYLDKLANMPHYIGGHIEQFINKELDWVVYEEA